MIVTDKEIERLTDIERERIISLQDESEFGKNLWNYYQFVSWAK